SLIRDKENELTTVRNAMEQNEEVLIRVYQEKERQYREQMCELRQKLQTSQQGENTLRIQLRQSEDNRNELQRNFDILSEEKTGLQKRCQQIERELYSIRVKFDDFVRDTKAAPKNCENCKRGIVNGNGNVKAPIPTPRLSKLMEKEDKELRGEVEELKDQVSTLRDQLNNQMRFFAEERKRWEHDRNKSGSPRSHFKNASQDVRTAVLLSNDRLI
uniref:Uncharacterized protein n=1 Tax=Panagrolaimus sp. JU765 TaxID=591449 RepID=A0AC34R5F4_9BILA